MTKPELGDKDLDVLFAASRRSVPDPSPKFLAELEVAALHAFQPKVAQIARVTVFEQLKDALGGWAGLSGLATAALAGVWIGLSPPDLFPDPLTIVSELSGTTTTLDSWMTGDADAWQEFEDG